MLKVEVGVTDRFRLDCALFGASDAVLGSAMRILRSDPIVGSQRPNASPLWDWEHGGFRIIYAISDDCSRLVLLRLAPVAAPKADWAGRIMRLVRAINDIKRLFGF